MQVCVSGGCAKCNDVSYINGQIEPTIKIWLFTSSRNCKAFLQINVLGEKTLFYVWINIVFNMLKS